MSNKSILFQTDSYKYSHDKILPEGTEYQYSYIESRGGRFTHTMQFGLQIFLKNV